jgi:hypothetical protein
MGFAELVIGPATSGRTRWLKPSYAPRYTSSAGVSEPQCLLLPGSNNCKYLFDVLVFLG